MSGMIAPHEGREIDLVMRDHKPLAVIERAKDRKQYRDAFTLVEYGVLSGHNTLGKEGREMVISKSPLLVENYFGLLRDGVERLGIKGYHRAMGCLFGYSPQDVEAFIDAEFDCDCSKCNGAMRQLKDDVQNRQAASA